MVVLLLLSVAKPPTLHANEIESDDFAMPGKSYTSLNCVGDKFKLKYHCVLLR